MYNNDWKLYRVVGKDQNGISREFLFMEKSYYDYFCRIKKLGIKINFSHIVEPELILIERGYSRK